MDVILVCRLCLAKDDVGTIFKKENEDLLAKLQLIRGVSIVEDGHLPQYICRPCSCELQFACDFILQYKATFNKLRNVSLHHKNQKEKPSTISFSEKKNDTKANQIEKEMQAVTADNTLIAEIVVKKETFSDDEEEMSIENKIMPGCSKYIYKCKTEAVNDSNAKSEDKLLGLHSDDRNFVGNCWEQLYKRKTNDENCKAQHVDSNEFLNAEWPMESKIIDIVVKEEAKFADEFTDEVESSGKNKSFHTVKPDFQGESCEAATLEDTKLDGKGNAANEHGVSSKRFHDDFRAQNMLLCDHRIESTAPECYKCKKYITASEHKNTTEEHQTKTANLSRTKFNECPKSFVRLKRLKKNSQENVLPTNDFDPNKNACLFNNGKRAQNPSLKIFLKQPGAVLSNSELQTCDKRSKSLANGHMLEKQSNSDGFKCESCNKRFSCQKYLRQHQIKHTNPELLRCDQCEKSFSNEQTMYQHRKWHLNPDAFKCEFCDKSFTCKKSIRQHRITHSNPELLTCEQCRKSFATEQAMNEHQILHLNPDAFKCKQCDKSFSCKKSLEQHTIIHSNPTSLTCEKCGKTFPYKWKLSEHQKWHMNPDTYKCEQCGKRCSSKHVLWQHKIKHSNPELLTCEKCRKTFSYVYMMRDHQMWHLNPDAFKCKECGKRCSSKQGLRRHKNKHSNDVLLTCEPCGKSFASAHGLNEHKMLHSNPDAFKCNQCDKKFSSKKNLDQHTIIHSNRGLLTCEQCGKSFLCVYLLKEHQKRHLNPDAFRCKQCDKMFSSTYVLRRHQLKHSNPELLTCE